MLASFKQELRPFMDFDCRVAAESIGRICTKYGQPQHNAIRHIQQMRADREHDIAWTDVTVPDVDFDVYEKLDNVEDGRRPLEFVKAFIRHRNDIGLDDATQKYTPIDILKHIRNAK